MIAEFGTTDDVGENFTATLNSVTGEFRSEVQHCEMMERLRRND